MTRTARATSGPGSVRSAGIDVAVGRVEVRARPANEAKPDPPRGVLTSAGKVDGVDVVAGLLNAIAGAGRIRLSMAEPAARIGLRTGAGNIHLARPRADGGHRVPNDPGAVRAVNAQTGAGNVSIHDR